MSNNIFYNASSFLIIVQDDLLGDEDVNPEVLDDSRVPFASYDVARKMASDALDWDEEELGGGLPSKAIIALRDTEMLQLESLELDSFADELERSDHNRQRLLLYTIRSELKKPFAEIRGQFVCPAPGQILTMLTGETRETLEMGFIIPVRVLKVTKDDTVIVKLESGIEGTISSAYRTDGSGAPPARLAIGSTLQALVMSLEITLFEAELSIQPQELMKGDTHLRTVQPDDCYDLSALQDEKDGHVSQKSRSSGRQQRVIKHPNFQNFSSGQAEEFLSSRRPGDCVVRPSSQDDHLAVTWKVTENVYQHIGSSPLLAVTPALQTY